MGRALPVSVRFCREAVFFRRKEVPSLSACRSRGEDVFPVDIRLRDRIGTLAGALDEQGRTTVSLRQEKRRIFAMPAVHFESARRFAAPRELPDFDRIVVIVAYQCPFAVLELTAGSFLHEAVRGLQQR